MFLIGNMKIENTEQLGQLIRAQRKKLGVTQKELAMVSGTGLRFIIELEKGKPTCQLGKALQVTKALGLTFNAESSGGAA
jgi:y4mF family transcriptional regulator